jgi:DNA polymerase V
LKFTLSTIAFLSFEGFDNQLLSHARTLRSTVKQWTGIPISIGVAPTKTLAKVANRLAKKQPMAEGVYILMTDSEQETALMHLELGDIFGIGKHLTTRLHEIGITNPLELRRAHPKYIRKNFGVVVERIVYELNGAPSLSLEDAIPNRKKLIPSRSFSAPIGTLHHMEEAVTTYTSRAAEGMRQQALATAKLFVLIETNPFRMHDKQYRASKIYN